MNQQPSSKLVIIKILFFFTLLILVSCNKKEKLYFDENFRKLPNEESAVYLREVDNDYKSYQEFEISTGQNIGYGGYYDKEFNFPRRSIWELNDKKYELSVHFDEFGKKEEVWIRVNGQARFKIKYKNGVLHGKSTVWNSKGLDVLTLKYNRGKLNGLITLKNKNKIKLEANFKNDELDGKYELKTGSKLIYELSFKSDSAVSSNIYFKNGQLALSENLIKRESKLYNIDGELVREALDNGQKSIYYYDNGKVHSKHISLDNKNLFWGETSEHFIVEQYLITSGANFRKIEYENGKWWYDWDYSKQFGQFQLKIYSDRQSKLKIIEDSIIEIEKKHRKTEDMLYEEINEIIETNIFESEPLKPLIEILEVNLEKFLE